VYGTVIGALHWSGQWIEELNGEIDELRFWRTTRSDSQIADNRGKSLTQDPDLIASWTFNGTFEDSTNGHHGSPVGDASFALPGAPVSPIHLDVPPLVRGQLATLVVSEVLQGSTTHFLYTLKGPGPLLTSYGFALDLGLPVERLGTATASSAGSVGLSMTVPPNAPAGLPVWLQAVEVSGSSATMFRLSNSVATSIQ